MYVPKDPFEEENCSNFHDDRTKFIKKKPFKNISFPFPEICVKWFSNACMSILDREQFS